MTNFLRIVDVMKKTGIAKSTIWLWISEGKFPKPIKLSPIITIWEEEKVDNWMKEKL
ncbi:putative transcriptional regulator, AlpA family [Arcobacter venerupis]|uniref:Transcriptional regulator, AlpA family n=1 Tax=Arcobacter venerupis TaxID=1054033 RepID=A0AAE7B9D4_9BACT|nr:AlpA family phage regulatory protein [Arcobacter venerupis]QKF67848.1 putative transcriptional regulator, AlpA family [Arcobacter venerupis]RWS49456.1 AlpA family transcriptional regulator [Arcobacter venerupis]